MGIGKRYVMANCDIAAAGAVNFASVDTITATNTTPVGYSGNFVAGTQTGVSTGGITPAEPLWWEIAGTQGNAANYTYRLTHSSDNVTFTTHPNSPGGAGGFSPSAAGALILLPALTTLRFLRVEQLAQDGTTATIHSILYWAAR